MDFSPLFVSLKISLVATAITFFLGLFALKFVFCVKNPAAKTFIDIVFTLPMVLPPSVIGFFLLIVFGKNGAVGAFFQTHFNFSFVFSVSGAILAATLSAFPLMYRTAKSAVDQIDKNIVDAAKTLGAKNNKIFWKICVPNARNGILAGTILAFARALGEFGATVMIAGNIPKKTQTIATIIFSAVQSGDNALAYKWVLIIFSLSFSTMVLMQIFVSKSNKIK